jgi:hypothetical protein
MNRVSCVVVLLVSLVLFAGCNKPGMNKKLALSDAMGVAATGATLDEAKNFDKTRVEVLTIANGLLSFVDTGKVASLPLDKAKEAMTNYMLEKGWGAYLYLVDSAFAYVDTVDLPVDKIGENNVLLVKAALEGIIRQAERSKAEWAVPWRNGVDAPRPASTAGE